MFQITRLWSEFNWLQHMVKLKLVRMVNLKTKSDKHANDNEKRRQSIKKREKAKLNQSQIIKNALSNSSLNNSGKKIVFSDEENDVGTGGNESNNLVCNKKNLKRNEKPALFDSSESENEDFEIREKTQFKGKKGFELLNLQSTYGNDDRFKIDERFFEDEKDEDQNETQNDEKSFSEEKTKQLKILGDILGTPVPEQEKEKKAKKRTYEMIRYDASNKEHEIYEIKTASNSGLSAITSNQTSKKKESKKRRKTDSEDTPRPKVSKEKFYEVSSEIKNRIKEKQENVGQFSLLEAYASNGVEKDEENEVDSEGDLEGDLDVFMNEEPMEIVNEQTEIKKDEKKENEKGVEAKGIWKEHFFFVENDERFNEAVQFINKKNSDEAKEAAENYDKTRKKLREILRLHLKKQMHNKNPFKNKVGGMNKKQLANSRFKNSKTYNKQKQSKKNSGRKT